MIASDALYELGTRGFSVLPGIVAPALLADLRRDIDAALEICREVQRRKGMPCENIDGAHHVVGLGASFRRFLCDRPWHATAQEYLGGKVMLNSYGINAIAASTAAYYQNVHRDVRFFTPSGPSMLTMIVMVDPFTADNGGTWLLPGSHHVEAKPSDEQFRRHAVQLTGEAGSVGLFDSLVWHAGGVNRTPHTRRAMTLTFTRPFYKPQADYVKLTEPFQAEFDEPLRELLGYYARVPTSLDEWYQPAAERFYRADQV